MSCYFHLRERTSAGLQHEKVSQPGKNMKLVDTLKPIKGEVVICLFLAMKFDLF